jgi:hypothetical protein
VNRTVGLYEGGYLFECGVYHPTGQCMMNLGYERTVGGFAVADPFCPVCRYAMVELLDPSKHGLIDADYEYEYPE